MSILDQLFSAKQSFAPFEDIKRELLDDYKKFLKGFGSAKTKEVANYKSFLRLLGVLKKSKTSSYSYYSVETADKQDVSDAINSLLAVDAEMTLLKEKQLPLLQEMFELSEGNNGKLFAILPDSTVWACVLGQKAFFESDYFRKVQEINNKYSLEKQNKTSEIEKIEEKIMTGKASDDEIKKHEKLLKDLGAITDLHLAELASLYNNILPANIFPAPAFSKNVGLRGIFGLHINKSEKAELYKSNSPFLEFVADSMHAQYETICSGLINPHLYTGFLGGSMNPLGIVNYEKLGTLPVEELFAKFMEFSTRILVQKDLVLLEELVLGVLSFNDMFPEHAETEFPDFFNHLLTAGIVRYLVIDYLFSSRPQLLRQNEPVEEEMLRLHGNIYKPYTVVPFSDIVSFRLRTKIAIGSYAVKKHAVIPYKAYLNIKVFNANMLGTDYTPTELSFMQTCVLDKEIIKSNITALENINFYEFVVKNKSAIAKLIPGLKTLKQAEKDIFACHNVGVNYDVALQEGYTLNTFVQKGLNYLYSVGFLNLRSLKSLDFIQLPENEYISVNVDRIVNSYLVTLVNSMYKKQQDKFTYRYTSYKFYHNVKYVDEFFVGQTVAENINAMFTDNVFNNDFLTGQERYEIMVEMLDMLHKEAFSSYTIRSSHLYTGYDDDFFSKGKKKNKSVLQVNKEDSFSQTLLSYENISFLLFRSFSLKSYSESIESVLYKTGILTTSPFYTPEEESILSDGSTKSIIFYRKLSLIVFALMYAKEGVTFKAYVEFFKSITDSEWLSYSFMMELVSDLSDAINKSVNEINSSALSNCTDSFMQNNKELSEKFSTGEPSIDITGVYAIFSRAGLDSLDNLFGNTATFKVDDGYTKYGNLNNYYNYTGFIDYIFSRIYRKYIDVIIKQNNFLPNQENMPNGGGQGMSKLGEGMGDAVKNANISESGLQEGMSEMQEAAENQKSQEEGDDPSEFKEMHKDSNQGHDLDKNNSKDLTAEDAAQKVVDNYLKNADPKELEALSMVQNINNFQANLQISRKRDKDGIDKTYVDYESPDDISKVSKFQLIDDDYFYYLLATGQLVVYDTVETQKKKQLMGIFIDWSGSMHCAHKMAWRNAYLINRIDAAVKGLADVVLYKYLESPFDKLVLSKESPTFAKDVEKAMKSYVKGRPNGGMTDISQIVKTGTQLMNEMKNKDPQLYHSPDVVVICDGQDYWTDAIANSIKFDGKVHGIMLETSHQQFKKFVKKFQGEWIVKEYGNRGGGNKEQNPLNRLDL